MREAKEMALQFTVKSLINLALIMRIFTPGSAGTEGFLLRKSNATKSVPSVTTESSEMRSETRAIEEFQQYLDGLLSTSGLRAKRTSGNSCHVTLDDVNEMVNLMKTVLNNTTSRMATTTLIPPFPDVSDASNCEEAKLNLINHVAYISHLLLNFKNTKENILDVNNQQFMLQLQVVALQKEINEIKQNSTAQLESKAEELQNLKAMVESSNYELEISKHQQNMAQMMICALEIKLGKAEEAKDRFLGLNDRNLLGAVIEEAYDKDKTLEIMNFIDELPWLSDLANGFNALLDVLRKNNDLANPIVLKLHRSVEKSLTSTNEKQVLEESKPKLLEVKEKLKQPIIKTLDKLGKLIRSENSNEVETFTENWETVFADNVHDITKAAYKQDEGSAKTIIKFAKKLETEMKVKVLSSLLQSMKDYEKIYFTPVLEIAYITQQLESNIDEDEDESSLIEEIFSLKSNLPSMVQTIIWNEVCILNDYYGGYLYEGRRFDNERSEVLASKIKQGNYTWKIEGTEDDSRILFEIMNVASEKKLYAGSDDIAYNDIRRRVFMQYSPEPLFNGKWMINDVDWEKGLVYIVNSHYNEILSSDKATKKELSYAPSMLDIFTWRKTGLGLHLEWSFVDCDNTQA